MRIIENPIWVYYKADEEPYFDENKVGKMDVFLKMKAAQRKFAKQRLNKILLGSVNIRSATMG